MASVGSVELSVTLSLQQLLRDAANTERLLKERIKDVPIRFKPEFDSQSIASLAKALRTTYGEAQKFSETLGLTAAQAGSALSRLRELESVGATTAEKYRALSTEFGLGAVQIYNLGQASKAVVSEQERLAKAAQNSGTAIAALAQATGLNFTQAQKLAQSLGLTAQKTTEAIVAFQQLKSAGATAEQQTAFLKREMGLTAEQIRKVADAAKNAKQDLGAFGNVITGVFQGIGQQVASQALASIQQTITGTIQSFLAFSGAVKQVGVVTGQSGTPELAELEATIKELGIATSKTPQEIAQMTVSLSRAGFTAQESTVAIEGIVRASEATGESLESVGDIIAKTIRSFARLGITVEDSQLVADLLVQTANATQTSIGGLGESLKYVSAQAAAANQPLDDVLILLGLLGDSGIQGSQAGTNLAAALEGLKQASAGANSEFTNLVRGNNKRVEAFNLINTEVRNADGTMKSLLEVLPQLKDSLNSLSQQDQDIILKALFGVEGGRAIQVLLNTTGERIDLVTQQIKNAGGVSVQAGQDMLQGLGGALTLLEGSLGALQVEVGEAIAPALESIVREFTDAVNALISSDELDSFLTLLGNALKLAADNSEILSVVLNTLLARFIALKAVALFDTFRQSALGMELIAVASGKAQVSMKLLGAQTRATFAAFGQTALIAGAVAALQLVIGTYQDIKRAGDELRSSQEGVADALNAIEQAARANAESAEQVQQSIAQEAEQNLQAIQDEMSAWGQFTNFLIDAINDAIALFTFEPVFQQLARLESIPAPIKKLIDLILGGLNLIPQLPDATTAAVNDATVAFGNLRQSTDDILSRFEAFDDVFAGVKFGDLDESQLAQLKAFEDGIETSISALKNSKPVTEADIAARDQQVAALERAQAAIEAYKGATEESTATTADSSEVVEEAAKNYDAAFAELESAYTEQQIAIANAVANGNKTEEQARQENLKAEQDYYNRRIALNQERLAALEEAQKSITDAEELKKNQDDILATEQAIQTDRLAIAQAGANARLEAEREALQKQEEAQQQALEEFERANQRANQAIEQSQSSRIAAIREAQLSGAIGEDDATQQIQAILQDTTRKTIEAKRREIAEVNRLREEGVLSAEEAADRETALITEIGNLNLQRIEEQIAAQEELRRARLEELDDRVQDANRSIGDTETGQITSIRDAQRQGVIDAEQAAAAIAKVQQTTIQRTIQARRNELAVIKQLLAEGTLSAEEAADREAEINSELTDLKLQEIEQQIAAQEAASQQAIEAIEREGNLRKQALQNASEGLDAAKNALQTELDLLNAKARLEQSLNTLEEERLQTRIALAEAAGNEEKADRLRRRVIREQRDNLEASFQTQREQLELQQRIQALDLAKESVTARIAEIEAEIALRKAIAEGATQEEIAGLQQILQLRRGQVTVAQAVQRSQEGVFEIEQQNLAAEQGIALENQRQAEIQAGIKPGAGASSIQIPSGGGFSSSGSVGSSGSGFNDFRGSVNASTSTGVTAQSLLEGTQPKVSNLSDSIDSSQAAAQAFTDGTVKIVERLDKLEGAIMTLANSPRSLAVNAPDPVADMGKVLSSVSQWRQKGAKV